CRLCGMVLESMSVRLGIGSGMDLGEMRGDFLNKGVGIMLWIIGELGIMGSDIGEVIGRGMGLDLMLGIGLIVGG
ncbi:divalent metal cation transporter, partial [Staphylococcus epidermidis]|uniref:divalent metal cation transporter n=1 Tax=Staphylococcus epidermidis TaxID=1282 RepID=UPI0016435D6F